MFVTETTDDKFMKITVIILVMEAITIVFTPLSIVGGKNGCSSRNKRSFIIKWMHQMVPFTLYSSCLKEKRVH